MPKIKRVSDTRLAITMLNSNWPWKATPDKLKETLGLSISYATLGRKLRQAAVDGFIVRDYYINDRGEEIAQYQGVFR